VKGENSHVSLFIQEFATNDKLMLIILRKLTQIDENYWIKNPNTIALIGAAKIKCRIDRGLSSAIMDVDPISFSCPIE